MSSNDPAWVQDMHANHYLQSWSTQGHRPIVIAGGEGSWFWDTDGKRYLDFQSQLVNLSLGFQHPAIVEAIKAQADKLCYIGPSMGSDVRSELAALMKDITPGNLVSTFFTTGGAAANETAVRLATSFGYYAAQQNIPFHLAGESQRWRPPAAALSWWGVLNYLAKADNDGREPLAKVLGTLQAHSFVVVLVSKPDPAINRELVSLQKRGVQILAIFITPEGSLPPAAVSQEGRGLEQRVVDPHSWTAVFDEL